MQFRSQDIQRHTRSLSFTLCGTLSLGSGAVRGCFGRVSGSKAISSGAEASVNGLPPAVWGIRPTDSALALFPDVWERTSPGYDKHIVSELVLNLACTLSGVSASLVAFKAEVVTGSIPRSCKYI